MADRMKPDDPFYGFRTERERLEAQLRDVTAERDRLRAALILNGIHLKDRNDFDKMQAAKEATEAALGVEYDALTRTEDDGWDASRLAPADV